MKANLFLSATLLIGCLTLYSCDSNNPSVSSKEYETVLGTMYPNARSISWEQEGGYYVADFWRADLKTEAEAWFNQPNGWEMTITEITFQMLPEAVKNAFRNSAYAGWKVDDVKMIERRNMETIYKIEVEQGEQKYDIYYTADGVLVKTVVDTDNDNKSGSQYFPETMPASVSSFISTRYPGAKIIDIDHEDNTIEVDISNAGAYCEVVFNKKSEWQYTKTEIESAAVPANVMAAFKSSQYAKYRIDDVDFYETATETYYLFELEAEPNDIYLKIYANGAIE